MRLRTPFSSTSCSSSRISLASAACVARLGLAHFRLRFGRGWWRGRRRFRRRLRGRLQRFALRLGLLDLGPFFGAALRLRGITATPSDAPQSLAPRLRRYCSTSSGFAGRALVVHSEHRLAALVGQADLAETALARRAHARADQLEAAVARRFGEQVEPLVAHSPSTRWSTSPTMPPTSVPLMRIYWRSRPTAASSRAVTVRASQPRIVSDTSLTIELP